MIVLLLDMAADKIPPWLPLSDSLGQSSGLQGVRLYSIDPVQSVIEAQHDALAGLSSDFSLRVLIPFLTRLEEYDYWLSLIRKRLPGLPVGAMAETPSIVLDIGRLRDHADFVAIGCNDLLQGLYAADRDPGVRVLDCMMAIPGVLELISSQVIILNSVETEGGPLFLYNCIPSRQGLDQRTFKFTARK